MLSRQSQESRCTANRQRFYNAFIIRAEWRDEGHRTVANHYKFIIRHYYNNIIYYTVDTYKTNKKKKLPFPLREQQATMGHVTDRLSVNLQISANCYV